MLEFSVTSTGEDQAARVLADLQYGLTDLHPLGVRIGEVVEVDNMAARMLGLDRDGQPFAPLAPATLADPRRGPGPALAPMEMSSRIVADLTMEVIDVGAGAVDVVGSWPNMPFLRYHVEGTKYMPSRDPVGVRPEGWAEIEIALDDYVQRLLSNRY